ncbi:hypothetical protein KIH74_32140 [Kineosporia sp. J2-2]|uniref:Uncharacterized protein n=1 Tax=Kineosporia corallincola TaxID=2835133 RepID=A0ABS5TS66_9ACTN|nr:hypothetical protein [Kineosporia corallincola]MBT0773639.1 hypothetical protein [Kineosporia corallincola]
MLPEILTGAAAAGGTAVVAAMAEDSWQQVKAHAVRLLTREPDDQDAAERVAGRLERSRTAIETAAPARREQVTAQHTAAWTLALEELLEEHPDRLDKVREFARQNETHVVLNIRAHDQAQVPVVARGVQYNTFGVPPRHDA